MNIQKKRENEPALSEIEKIQKWFRIGFLVLGPVYVFGIVIYKGITNFRLEPFQALILGFFLALIVFGLLLLADFGLIAWDKSTTWLTKQLKKYPKARRTIIFPLVAGITLGSIYISVFYWPWDNLSRFMFFIYFGVALPAALFSILREDRMREESLLSQQITPELITNNPQAAIEHSFTLFEEHLRKRLDVGSDIYGDSLINLAYGQSGKLTYGDVENENRGARNFISGAYATFRNPRKHRIIEDDEQTVFAIIKVVELLIKIVDDSKENKPQL